jgi:hypothetical protein
MNYYFKNLYMPELTPGSDDYTLNMEAGCSSETLLSTYNSTQRYNPEEEH